ALYQRSMQTTKIKSNNNNNNNKHADNNE
ncbi:unnamed protein product, partial [Rotaria magnacalcarata]